LKLKGCLYKSCIRSVMSYGSECWAMKKVDTRRMQAAEMRMIRMCEKMLYDVISNGLLRDKAGVEDIGNHLGETGPRWLEHLERMDETKLVKSVREKNFHDIYREEG